MTAGRRGVATILLLMPLMAAGVARGAFERLPGPVPGRSGGWVWDWPVRSGHERGARFAFGTPAAVPGLGWSHARVRTPVSGWRIEGEAYVLGLEDLYREMLVGASCGRGPITIGVRWWQVAWRGESRRLGWGLSARAAVSVGGIDLHLAAQEVPIGSRDRSSPPARFGGGVGYRVSPLLQISGVAFLDSAGPGGLLCVRWAPIPEISFRELVRAPGNSLESGIELRAGDATIGLWLEPSDALGMRAGISCALE